MPLRPHSEDTCLISMLFAHSVRSTRMASRSDILADLRAVEVRSHRPRMGKDGSHGLGRCPWKSSRIPWVLIWCQPRGHPRVPGAVRSERSSGLKRSLDPVPCARASSPRLDAAGEKNHSSPCTASLACVPPSLSSAHVRFTDAGRYLRSPLRGSLVG